MFKAFTSKEIQAYTLVFSFYAYVSADWFLSSFQYKTTEKTGRECKNIVLKFQLLSDGVVKCRLGGFEQQL